MIIPVTLNTPSSSAHSNSTPKLPSGLAKISNDEVVLIELQGFLDVEANTPEERNGKFVGKLKVDDSGKPSLVIGHHLLEGKVAALAKPLAIFHRVGGPAPRIAEASSATSASLSSAGKGKGKMNVDAGDDTPRKRQKTSGANNNDADADEEEMDIDTNPANTLSKSLKLSTLNDPSSSSDDETSHEAPPRASREENNKGGTTSWTILGIVKKKIIFSKRPMPISAMPKKLGGWEVGGVVLLLVLAIQYMANDNTKNSINSDRVRSLWSSLDMNIGSIADSPQGSQGGRLNQVKIKWYNGLDEFHYKYNK
ncbi:hypothetical protein BJ165DRAFT_1402472 [Panaeolus papilionaceus]|nr:hypothetical protein BJ165DRAFT_1402472 [Panaeolus papilionaceus]